MNYNALRKLFFVPSLIAILALASCQKDVDPGGPVLPIPDEVKDSTFLIKQLSFAYDIGSPTEDSIIETFFYDTVNKKIVITWDGPDDNYIPPGTDGELGYNAKGLLSHITYKYPGDYIPQVYDYKTIDITYDAQNVLQKIVVENGVGDFDSRTFTKTALPAGNYQLTWNEIGYDEDSSFRRVEFDNDNKAIVNYTEYFYYPSPGDPARYKTILIDSFAYDAGGSVTKVFKKVDDVDQNISLDFILYEYVRQTKGDQLYNQRQVLMNGLANIPFGDYDGIIEDAFGILSFTLGYDYLQYSKYPVQTTKARLYDGSFKDFISSSTFDSKNRLTKFTGFFHDYDLDPIEYRVKYYK
jgi:hypothetical protein